MKCWTWQNLIEYVEVRPEQPHPAVHPPVGLHALVELLGVVEHLAGGVETEVLEWLDPGLRLASGVGPGDGEHVVSEDLTELEISAIGLRLQLGADSQSELVTVKLLQWSGGEQRRKPVSQNNSLSAGKYKGRVGESVQSCPRTKEGRQRFYWTILNHNMARTIIKNHRSS